MFATITDKDYLLPLANLYSATVILPPLLRVLVASPRTAPVVALTSSLVLVRLLAVAAAPADGAAVLQPIVDSVAKTPLANALLPAMLATTVPVVPTARLARAPSSGTAAAAPDSAARQAPTATRAARAPSVAAPLAPNYSLELLYGPRTSVSMELAERTARLARAPALEIAVHHQASVVLASLTAERAAS